MIPADPITPILDNVAAGIRDGIAAAKAKRFDDGGPAMSCPSTPDCGHGRALDNKEAGMSLLDWFAGQAMSMRIQQWNCGMAGGMSRADMATEAYYDAAAMIAEKRRLEGAAS